MKRAIVFGATGGIGKAIAAQLAAKGWSLYIHFNHSSQEAEKMVAEFIDKYPSQEFFPLKLDFLAEDDEVIKTTVASLLPLNAAIFTQGITNYQFLGSQELTQIEKIMQINLLVPIKITSLLESQLLKRKHGRIIFIGSVYGGQASALESVYSASKGGLSSFAQGYAREVASAHLTVNVIAPGAVDTPMNAIFDAETLNEVKNEIPAGRLAEPSDIVFWVENLLDKRSDYLTGQTIYVDGGWLV